MKINNRILDFLSRREQEMLSFLRQMVLIQSHSYNKAGVDAVAELIQENVAGNYLSCELLPNEVYGNHLLVRTRAYNPQDKQVLLVGHMDTVFPEDTDFKEYKEDSDHAYGPGVIDMKGGLVAGLYALKALDSIGSLGQIPLTFVLNSDEEIGSVSSGRVIRKEAANSAFAFVLEAGGLDGSLVTGRKGNLSIVLRVNGKYGHAAFAAQDKGSAILEMAHKTIRLEQLNDPDKEITANVGVIKGGIGPNTIAGSAEAQIDFRYVHPADAISLTKRIQQIVSNCQVKHTSAEYTIKTARPAMSVSSANRDLFRQVRRVAHELGYPLSEEFRQGVSDANLIADENIPVLDGMGPIGAKDHSDEEYMLKESLLQRTVLLSHAIKECWDTYLQRKIAGDKE